MSGILTRVGLVARRIPSTVRDHAASISLGLGASMGASGIAYNVIVPPRVEAVLARAGEESWRPHFFGPFGSDAVILYALWVVAGLFAVFGLHRTARVTVALTIPAAIVIRATSDQLQQLLAASSTTLVSLELFALIAVLGAAGRGRSGRVTVAGVFVGAGALTIVAAVVSSPASTFSLGFGRDGFTQTVEYWLAFAAPVALVVAAVLTKTRLTVWAGAILLALVPIVLTFVVAGGDARGISDRVTIAAAVGIVGVSVRVLLRLFGLRISITRTTTSR